MLIQASKNGDLNLAWKAVENRAEIQWKDQNGWDALVWASNNGHLELVMFLIENQAQIYYENLEKYFA